MIRTQNETLHVNKSKTRPEWENIWILLFQ